MSTRERAHRLSADSYVGRKTMSFTACVAEKNRYFTSSEKTVGFVESLEFQAHRHRCDVPIYCFMPDHLHVLVRGLEDSSQIKKFFDDFKTHTSLIFANEPGSARWQKDYYDHVVRHSEDWKSQAFYILNNPVRLGLVQDPYEYPMTGSIGFDLRELFFDLTW